MKPLVSFKKLVAKTSRAIAKIKNIYAYVRFIFISISYSIYIKRVSKIIDFDRNSTVIIMWKTLKMAILLGFKIYN